MMAPSSWAASNQGHREVRVGFDGRRERAGQARRLLGDRLARVTRVSAERVPGTPDDPHKCDAVEKHKACSATQGFAGARLLTHRAKGGIYGPENAGARRITRPAARSGTVVSGRNRGMTAVARCINPASSPSARACEAIRSTGGEAGIRTREQGLSPVNGLANRRFRPLSHLSARPDRAAALAGRRAQTHSTRMLSAVKPRPLVKWPLVKRIDLACGGH